MKLFNKAFASLVILGALWAGGAQAALVKPGFGPSFPDFNLSVTTFYIGSNSDASLGLSNGEMVITVGAALQFTESDGTDRNASLLTPPVTFGPMVLNAAGDVTSGGAWNIFGSVDTLASNELLLSGVLTKFGSENTAGTNWTIDATSSITGGALSGQYTGSAYFLFPHQNFAISAWDGSWVGNGGQTNSTGSLDITTPKLIEVPVVPALWLMVPGLLLMLRKSKKA